MALTELKGTKGGTQVVRIERGPVRVFAQGVELSFTERVRHSRA